LRSQADKATSATAKLARMNNSFMTIPNDGDIKIPPSNKLVTSSQQARNKLATSSQQAYHIFNLGD
jgi:hypothetical protein